LVGACKSYFVALVLLSLRSAYDVTNNYFQLGAIIWKRLLVS